MAKIVKIIVILILVILALIGLFFLSLSAYSHWFFASEKQCVEQIYYSLGTLDDRHGLSKTEYLNVFKDAEDDFESTYGKNILSHYEGSESPQNVVRYNITFDPAIQAKINSLESFVSENADLHEKIDGLLEEHAALEKEYEKVQKEYEVFSNEYKIFSDKQSEYNRKYEDGSITFEELEVYQDKKREMYEETRVMRSQVNELQEQVTAKAIEANTNIKEDKLLRSSFEEIDQDSLGRALKYIRTPFSYDITVLYFSDKKHLQSLISSSFHSILDEQGADGVQFDLVMKENNNESIDKDDLRFTLCD